jgi:hypothetical protein
MNDIDKIFIIQWIGPFLNLDDLKKWEKDSLIANEFCLYLLSGKEYRKRYTSLYCGKTEMKTLSSRFKNHKKYELIKDRDLNIWVGRFSFNKNAISENIDIVETLIISHWQPNLNEKKKAYYPGLAICVLNSWYKKDSITRYQNRIHPVQQLDDVIFYDINSNIVWGAERLKKRN